MNLLSIITVNLNNASGLRRTIDSVAGQSNREFELIVIDGASTDGSIDVIKEYECFIKYWVSEPDSGIYEAMNKGILKAVGEYCLFLNSGDWLRHSEVVRSILPRVDGKADIYYSDLYVSDCAKSWLISYPRDIDVNHFIGDTISHQNSLIRRQLLVRLGLYRTDFKIAADWYFFLYASYVGRAMFIHIPETIAYYFHRGMSTDSSYEEIKEAEHRRGIEDVFGALGESLNELRDYRSSVYGKTIRAFGYRKSLHFLLKAYRYIARRLPASRGCH